MKEYKFRLFIFLLFIVSIFILSCKKEALPKVEAINETKITWDKNDTALFKVFIENDIAIDEYFDYINEVIAQYDSLVPYDLTEHLLIHNNEWLIDSFAVSDYYRQMEKGNFIYNQKAYVVLHQLDSLLIPNEKQAIKIQEKLQSILIDVNIPEFKLRILKGDSIIHTFPVRVGQVGEKFMETVGRDVKMKTRVGKGKIIRINRNPRWQNPVDGHIYETTRRDDLERTLVPRIPFLIPEINGKQWGQLIHPTTNPKTLGKAYSNGCIGTSEGDAWQIYFHAPIGTKMNIRYDLVIEENGTQILLRDIYD